MSDFHKNNLPRIALIGANGKMGKKISKTIEDCVDFTFATNNNTQLKLDISDDISLITPENTDIAVEFTIASESLQNVQNLLKNGVKNILVGTSGWNNSQISILEDFIKDGDFNNVKIFIVPNFSISAVLLEKWSIEAAKYFTDSHILEFHHKEKLDKPSGTAKRLQEQINSKNSNHNPEISSIRQNGFMAKQSVIFTSFGERLLIEQDVLDRNAFMNGIIKALHAFSDNSLLNNGISIGLESIIL